jgi:hypothetical protein
MILDVRMHKASQCMEEAVSNVLQTAAPYPYPYINLHAAYRISPYSFEFGFDAAASKSVDFTCNNYRQERSALELGGIPRNSHRGTLGGNSAKTIKQIQKSKHQLKTLPID